MRSAKRTPPRVETAGGPKQPFRRLKDLRSVATRYTKLALGIEDRKLDQALRRGCPDSRQGRSAEWR